MNIIISALSLIVLTSVPASLGQYCNFDFEDPSELLNFGNGCDGAKPGWEIVDRPEGYPAEGYGDKVLTMKEGVQGCIETTKKVVVIDNPVFTVDFLWNGPTRGYADVTLALQCAGNVIAWKLLSGYRPAAAKWFHAEKTYPVTAGECTVKLTVYRNSQQLAIDRINIIGADSSTCYAATKPVPTTTSTTQPTTTSTEPSTTSTTQPTTISTEPPTTSTTQPTTTSTEPSTTSTTQPTTTSTEPSTTSTTQPTTTSSEPPTTTPNPTTEPPTNPTTATQSPTSTSAPSYQDCYFDFEDPSELLNFGNNCDGAKPGWEIVDRPEGYPAEGYGDKVLTMKEGIQGCLETTRKVVVSDNPTIMVDFLWNGPASGYSDVTLALQCAGNVTVWKLLSGFRPAAAKWFHAEKTFPVTAGECTVKLTAYRNSQQLAIDRITVNGADSSTCYTVTKPEPTRTTSILPLTTTTEPMLTATESTTPSLATEQSTTRFTTTVTSLPPTPSTTPSTTMNYCD